MSQALRGTGGVGKVRQVVIGVEMRIWAIEKGYIKKGSGVGRCAVWKPHWGGRGGRPKALGESIPGDLESAVPAPKASSGSASSGCTYSAQIPN